MNTTALAGPALRVSALHAVAGEHALLHDVEVELARGQVLAVLGASGAGKSTFGLAVLGEAAPGVTLSGRVGVDGTELLPARCRHPSAGRVAHVPQSPGGALDPVRRVGAVLDELAATVHGTGRGAREVRRQAVARALDAARLEPDLAARFPHQLSGGQQQRVALALTLVVDPAVVVLDEPTTGLDPVTTAEVVRTLADVAADGTALVVLTHDLAVARALAHEVVVLHDGAVVSRELPEAELVGGGGSDGTSLTLDDRIAAPFDGRHAERLAVSGLGVSAGRATLLEEVDLTAGAGSCLAVVGRSGAGKTSLARALAGLRVPDGGRVVVDGQELAPALGSRDREQRRLVQYVHQDPRASFLEHRPVRDQVARPGVLLRGLDRAGAAAEADVLLARLGLDGATATRRPAGLSGGQLQRAALARALMARPAVLVGDEITSALDAEHRAGLLDALDRVRREEGTTVVLVSHDLALVSRVADDVAVLDAGRLVEHAAVADLWERPATTAARRLVATSRDPAVTA